MNSSYKSGLTAVAGGGQSTLPTIGSVSNGDDAWNRFTTVASAGDSATLPQAAPGLQYIIANATTTSMNVFPLLGDAINTSAANAQLAVAGSKTAIFTCMAQGFWNAVLSA